MQVEIKRKQEFEVRIEEKLSSFSNCIISSLNSVLSTAESGG